MTLHATPGMTGWIQTTKMRRAERPECTLRWSSPAERGKRNAEYADD